MSIAKLKLVTLPNLYKLGDDKLYPKKIYYEPGIFEYKLGKYLMNKYEEIEKTPIQTHNNIEELRTRGNEEFVEMKKYLIIGTRKTHKYVPNQKTSDFLVPYTSSGCSAMCLYCYLVCNYNKCSYLRVYVNVEEMLGNLIKKSNKCEKECTFEIGSNSDLILENSITGNLIQTIEEFGRNGKGFITFPTKFHMIDDLVNLNHNGKTIYRMSMNPQPIITKIEIGTSKLKDRIKALNTACEAGYKVGILIAPVILLPDWEKLYIELLDTLYEELTEKVKNSMFIEVIFMTYSYVHLAINQQAFPNAEEVYDKDLMTGRGRGKYHYRPKYKEKAESFLRAEIGKRFNSESIIYVV